MVIENGEIVIYHPDTSLTLEVIMNKETVWLPQQWISDLFNVDRTVVSKHLKNLFTEWELEEESICAIFAHMGNDGKQQYKTKFYNLDAILAIGYRVSSKNAMIFRRRASNVLKDYLLKGYAIHQRIEHLEQRITQTEKNVDFFVRMNLPPVEWIFYDGQVFDAYIFVSDLIKSAKKKLILIDNYLDETVLKILSKRSKWVNATLYTENFSSTFQLDLDKHNAQYPEIEIKITKNTHDRFLIIDNEVYHIWASIKDLGKKLFAFSKMKLSAEELVERIEGRSA